MTDWPKPLTDEELADIESNVNIAGNYDQRTEDDLRSLVAEVRLLRSVIAAHTERMKLMVKTDAALDSIRDRIGKR